MKIVIVGSGIAGLTAALELSSTHKVTLVTKGELAESNTRWAQGGIAAVMFDDDRVADHIADTLAAGAGLCNPAAVEVLCAEGPARIRDLIALGVDFDQREGELAKGLEAAHSYPRVLHAGGDATGLSIETALVRAVRRAPIQILEHTFACDLVLADNQVTGLEILTPDGHPQILAADAVLLASGGAGQLYLHTTNPSVATGDGVALALRAGAQVADLEFYQFHPTALAMPGATFLISEAVRGDGAVLLDAQGTRFMLAVDPAAELAPRDVVARGIARQMAKQGNQPVLLDATHLGPPHGCSAFLAERFPTIDAAVRARGLDWSQVPIPITPAAHYWMGGILTDLDGRTNLPGLYAIGEVACTGVHGANRLASNSLLESLVFAHRCAQLLLNPINKLTGEASGYPNASALGLSGTTLMEGASAPLAPSPLPNIVLLSEGAAEVEGPASPSAAPRTPIDRQTLQTLLWTHAGIERTATQLRAALHKLNTATAPGHSVESRETANLLTLARALVTAALAREESRGAHFRLDFPTPNPAWQHQSLYRGVAHNRRSAGYRGRYPGGSPMLSRPPLHQLELLVRAALDEDAPWGDLTSQTLIPAEARITAQLVAREDGILAGEDLFRLAFHLTDASVTVYALLHDGEPFTRGTTLATVEGPAQAILQAERVALNFTQRLSGIATHTARYVAAAAGTKARIVDTRKTTPGLRLIERYAVRCGGGHNHRYSLSDAVMAKDNHLATLGPVDLTEALKAWRTRLPHTTHIEVEVDRADQIAAVLAAGVDTILLDNFTTRQLDAGVAQIAGQALVEASGGITLDRIPEIAATGVDLISVGALTQNVRSLDLGLDVL